MNSFDSFCCQSYLQTDSSPAELGERKTLNQASSKQKLEDEAATENKSFGVCAWCDVKIYRECNL